MLWSGKKQYDSIYTIFEVGVASSWKFVCSSATQTFGSNYYIFKTNEMKLAKYNNHKVYIYVQDVFSCLLVIAF